MSTQTPDAESSKSSTPAYGPDWVGLDLERLWAERSKWFTVERARRNSLAIEKQRVAAEDAVLLRDFMLENADDHVLEASSPSCGETMRSPHTPPKALVGQMQVDNLRCFAGPHQVQLRPLTLIYGPNAAGKSTIIKGLDMLFRAIDASRHNAFEAWPATFPNGNMNSLLTYSEPDCDDPESVSWRQNLKLGASFPTSSGSKGQVGLSFAPHHHGPTGTVTTELGLADDFELSKKEFIPMEDDHPESSTAESFGNDPSTRFIVRERLPGRDWETRSEYQDPFLFSSDNRELQAHLFSMAYRYWHLGAHRGSPESNYALAEGPFSIEKRQLGLSNDYRSPGINGFGRYEVLNHSLLQMEVPYEFIPDFTSLDTKTPLGANAIMHPDIKWILRDTRTGAAVELDRIGYGVSQLLPILDVCANASNQIICIEEPELHLHPRLQARLANVLVDSVLSRGNQLIVETHSESILLRVRRLIRLGMISASDVALLYVSNTEGGGARVSRLELGDSGELLDPWPTGFFDDTLDDVLGGWE